MNNPSATSNPQQQNGFSDPLKLEATELKARIQSGEKIPTDQLLAFIKKASADLREGVKLPPTPRKVKPSEDEIDFF